QPNARPHPAPRGRMSYIDSHLLTNERVAFRTQLHWKVFIAPLLVAVFIWLPATIGLLMTQRFKVYALIPVAIALIGLAVAWLRRQTSEFAVTNRRVIVKLGVLSTRSFELLLPKVEGIAVNQGLMGKMFGYGDIVVTGSGGTKEIFTGIQNP